MALPLVGGPADGLVLRTSKRHPHVWVDGERLVVWTRESGQPVPDLPLYRLSGACYVFVGHHQAPCTGCGGFVAQPLARCPLCGAAVHGR